jgi:hypothetical protein
VTSPSRPLDLTIAALPVLGFCLTLRPLSLSGYDCFKNKHDQPKLACSSAVRFAICHLLLEILESGMVLFTKHPCQSRPLSFVSRVPCVRSHKNSTLDELCQTLMLMTQGTTRDSKHQTFIEQPSLNACPMLITELLAASNMHSTCCCKVNMRHNAQQVELSAESNKHSTCETSRSSMRLPCADQAVCGETESFSNWPTICKFCIRTSFEFIPNDSFLVRTQEPFTFAFTDHE